MNLTQLMNSIVFDTNPPSWRRTTRWWLSGRLQALARFITPPTRSMTQEESEAMQLRLGVVPRVTAKRRSEHLDAQTDA